MFFIIIFRKPISELIPKITKISKDGVIADSTPEAQLEKSNSEEVQELLNVVQNSIVISEIEEKIKSSLSLKKLSYEGDTAKILIRHLAGTQLLLNFEQIHSLIFGSQIFFLKKLNEVTGLGRNDEYVNSHFCHVQNLYKESFSSWTKEKYLEFLFARLLIVKQGEQLHITNLGVDYLIWLARSGKNESNPL
jgi:hypothetical protein